MEDLDLWRARLLIYSEFADTLSMPANGNKLLATISYLGLFFSVLTRNSWTSMPVESVYSWLESNREKDESMSRQKKEQID